MVRFRYRNVDIEMSISKCQYRNADIEMPISKCRYRNVDIEMSISKYRYRNIDIEKSNVVIWVIWMKVGKYVVTVSACYRVDIVACKAPKYFPRGKHTTV
jgi:hypothetical protein